jgi:hypothetical protein
VTFKKFHLVDAQIVEDEAPPHNRYAQHPNSLTSEQSGLILSWALSFRGEVRVSPSVVTIYHLEELRQGMPGLTATAGGFLAESAAVCLEDRQHQPGVRFSVKGSYRRTAHLKWVGATRQQQLTYADMQEATEYGAAGVAILTLKRAVGKVVVERSRKGDYFDYWLGSEGGGELFQNRERLEVSGILAGDEKKLELRVEQKRDQITRARGKLTKYVAVVEFGSPKAKVVKL